MVDEAGLNKRVGKFQQQQGSVLRDTTYDTGLLRALIVGVRSLQQEYGRLLDYWLCIHGLTFAQFRLGHYCEETLEEGTCDVGKEHAEGMAADKQAERVALAKQVGTCSCFVVLPREQGEDCEHELAAQELEGAADLTRPGQGG